LPAQNLKRNRRNHQLPSLHLKQYLRRNLRRHQLPVWRLRWNLR
jgi:hypothetical protein